jgi:hypothetical protein
MVGKIEIMFVKVFHIIVYNYDVGNKLAMVELTDHLLRAIERLRVFLIFLLKCF